MSGKIGHKAFSHVDTMARQHSEGVAGACSERREQCDSLSQPPGRKHGREHGKEKHCEKKNDVKCTFRRGHQASRLPPPNAIKPGRKAQPSSIARITPNRT